MADATNTTPINALTPCNYDATLDHGAGEKLESPDFPNCSSFGKNAETNSTEDNHRSKKIQKLRDFPEASPSHSVASSRIRLQEPDESNVERTNSLTELEQKIDKQTSESYLYEGNPLLDARYQRLIQLLVPLKSKGSEKQRSITRGKETRSTKKGDTICFKDICLNDTCLLMFKVMNISNKRRKNEL